MCAAHLVFFVKPPQKAQFLVCKELNPVRKAGARTNLQSKTKTPKCAQHIWFFFVKPPQKAQFLVCKELNPVRKAGARTNLQSKTKTPKCAQHIWFSL